MVLVYPIAEHLAIFLFTRSRVGFVVIVLADGPTGQNVVFKFGFWSGMAVKSRVY